MSMRRSPNCQAMESPLFPGIDVNDHEFCTGRGGESVEIESLAARAQGDRLCLIFRPPGKADHRRDRTSGADTGVAQAFGESSESTAQAVTPQARRRWWLPGS